MPTNHHQTPLNIISPLRHIAYVFGGKVLRVGVPSSVFTQIVRFNEECTREEMRDRAHLFTKLVNGCGFARIKHVRHNPYREYEAEVRASIPIPELYFLDPDYEEYPR